MSRRPYVTQARVSALAEQLTPVERWVLAQFRFVRLLSGQQLLQLAHGESATPSQARSMRRRLRRLVDWQLLARLPRTVGGRLRGSRAYVYGLGVAGQRLLDPDRGQPGRSVRSPRAPSWAFLGHTLQVSELFVRLSRSNGEMAQFQSEPACWRPFAGPGGREHLLKPDAFIVTTSPEFEDHWFIEIDRATESAAALRAKIERYGSYYRTAVLDAGDEVFPLVLWLVPDEQRRVTIENVVAAHGPGQQLHRVTRFTNAVDTITNVVEVDDSSVHK